MNEQEEAGVNKVYQQMQEELEQEKLNHAQFARGQVSLFNSDEQDNLIRWQLDLREDLDRIYHLLRGDLIVEQADGNVGYQEPDNPNLKPFNEFGVQLIMNIMSFYLNRNTILSNYDETTINWKILDFGVEMSDLIFNRYEEMMITLDIDKIYDEIEGEEEDDFEVERRVSQIVKSHLAEKMKLYPMMCKELTDTVHSAYLRAYHGGERESLRTARTVTQTQPLYNNNPMGGVPGNQVKSKWYMPRR